MEYKTTNRLFRGAYQYKIVLVCAGASLFRSGNIGHALAELKKINLPEDAKNTSKWRTNYIKSQDDIDYNFKLASRLLDMKDFEIRVESPWISIYTNDQASVDAILNLDSSKVKYISVPPATGIAENTIVMPKINFDYRVTLGKTTNPNLAFIEWAEKSPKLRLTKSCIRDLTSTRSWGGTHFYVTGDNTLLMARMHLGGCISKIERIVKA
jgi:hypothetical protein